MEGYIGITLSEPTIGIYGFVYMTNVAMLKLGVRVISGLY